MRSLFQPQRDCLRFARQQCADQNSSHLQQDHLVGDQIRKYRLLFHGEHAVLLECTGQVVMTSCPLVGLIETNRWNPSHFQADQLVSEIGWNFFLSVPAILWQEVSAVGSRQALNVPYREWVVCLCVTFLCTFDSYEYNTDDRNCK